MEKQQLISERNEYIRNLDIFLTSSKTLVCNTLKKLNWSEESTFLKKNDMQLHICPLDPSHRMSSKNIEGHVNMCRWHKQGYRDDITPLPDPGPTSAGTVVIDQNLREKIILEAAAKDTAFKLGAKVRDRPWPQTSDRYYTDFTSDERRALYDYVVAQTTDAIPKLKEFSLAVHPDPKDTQLTKEQLMAMERDTKRRRIRYRSAKVHTKSKNYSEVLREVINSQMLGYEDWVKDQLGIEHSSETVETEKKDSEEQAEGSKPKMVWLDWDFRSNPHIRWKYVLEKEKAKAKMKEPTEQNPDNKPQRDRPRDDRKNQNKEDPQRYRYRDRDKRYWNESDHRHSRRRDFDHRRERSRSHQYQQVPEQSSDKTEYHHLKYKHDRLKDYERDNHRKHRADVDDNWKQGEVRHQNKTSNGNGEDPKSSRKSSCSQQRRGHYDFKVKEETADDYKECNFVKYENVKNSYKEKREHSESNSEDNNFSQPQNNKHKKRKSKKKYKHKHKKKKKHAEKQRTSSSSDSSN